MSDDDKNVVSFPSGDERTRKIVARVNWRASQPVVEWRLYLKEDADKLGLDPAELEKLIKARIAEVEKKAREEQAIEDKHEAKQERAERAAERADEKVKREERRSAAETARERLQRQEAMERAAKKAAKRERALSVLLTSPSATREDALKALALELGEDVSALTA